MATKTHITSQGDTWDTIAKTYYDNEIYMEQLIAANPSYRYVMFFSAGISLTIPEVSESSVNYTLPPWKE